MIGRHLIPATETEAMAYSNGDCDDGTHRHFFDQQWHTTNDNSKQRRISTSSKITHDGDGFDAVMDLILHEWRWFVCEEKGWGPRIRLRWLCRFPVREMKGAAILAY
ncbi:hypothetical protein Acr_27g0008890 [Actinidia rufa]|uniref:Uncharacterized protein n=1 Tax=Actinidia rufa TaxID=165716 RepID=A0A7J0H7S2_9ERIC|nr:hypothetical protein Acr_27g0008890 [Actinidia rufa]